MTHHHQNDQLANKEGKDSKTDAIASVVIVLAIVGMVIFWVSNQ